jgi:hypothetical protein
LHVVGGKDVTHLGFRVIKEPAQRRIRLGHS